MWVFFCRTLKSYALLISALQYLHSEIGEIMDEEGLTMDNFLNHFLPARFADTIRDTHEEVFYFINEIGHQGV